MNTLILLFWFWFLFGLGQAPNCHVISTDPAGPTVLACGP